MRNVTFKIIIVAVGLICVLGATAPRQYWQDRLLKPPEQWEQSYTTHMPEMSAFIMAADELFRKIGKNDSDIAFTVNQLLILTNTQGLALQKFETRLQVLEQQDPNIPADPNE